MSCVFQAGATDDVLSSKSMPAVFPASLERLDHLDKTPQERHVHRHVCV